MLFLPRFHYNLPLSIVSKHLKLLVHEEKRKKKSHCFLNGLEAPFLVTECNDLKNMSDTLASKL